MKPSRTFKENVLVVGFFTFSLAVLVVLALGIWKGATSRRLAPPAEAVPAGDH
jgi:hypothetical protein